MINRVLIRIKVVQLLYSYLLTEKLFTLESQPTPPTKEKRFAYRLYLDMLVLMTRIAHAVVMRGGHTPLTDNRFIRTVEADEKIKSQIVKDREEPTPLCSEALVERLAAAVRDAAFFKTYRKSADKDMGADLRVWRDIFNLIIRPDSALEQIYTELEGYSPRGVERMYELMEATFTNFSSSQGHLSDAAKTLTFSLQKAYDLYFRLLQLAVELTHLQEQNLDAARHKYLVTDQDLNPDVRFVENSFIRDLEENPDFRAYVDKNKISWAAEDPILLNNLLKQVLASDVYRDYMERRHCTPQDDCQLWRNLFKFVLFPGDDLNEALEDRSVFWNDDLDTIGTFVLKTVRNFSEGAPEPLMPMFKDDEDSRFGRELFQAVVKNKEEYRSLLEASLNTESWEADRMAFMDTVIAMTALAEILNFPKIPVSVSINEYLEIAKAYSTPKSSHFINGLLAGAVTSLRDSGRLLKP